MPRKKEIDKMFERLINLADKLYKFFEKITSGAIRMYNSWQPEIIKDVKMLELHGRNSYKNKSYQRDTAIIIDNKNMFIDPLFVVNIYDKEKNCVTVDNDTVRNLEVGELKLGRFVQKERIRLPKPIAYILTFAGFWLTIKVIVLTIRKLFLYRH